MEKLARFISTLFVPPTFNLFLFTYLGLAAAVSTGESIAVIATGVVFGFVMPVSIFVYLMKKGRVADIDATVKEERNSPYMAGVFIHLTAFFLLTHLETARMFGAVWLAYAVVNFLMIPINKYWKISAHAIGASSPIAVMILLFGWEFAWLFIIFAAVGASRLVLKVHTPLQVLAGGAYGFLLTYFLLNFFKG